AETIALRKAGATANGATLYCSLEPCSHHGKTPPCTNAIKEAGIKRVVFSAIDRNPLVNGKGQEQLKSAGIAVDQIELPAVNHFYAPFFHSILKQRPYVIAKVGATANGIISPADRNSR